MRVFRHHGDQKRIVRMVISAVLTGAFATLQFMALPVTACAAEGLYAVYVSDLKADRLDQTFTMEAKGASLTVSMADMMTMPVVVQENADGSKLCCIADTYLPDMYMDSLNQMLKGIPAEGQKVYYLSKEKTSFIPYSEAGYYQINEAGRSKILNELHRMLVSDKRDNVKVTLGDTELQLIPSEIPEELAADRYTLQGTCTTSYKGSSANRCNNVERAAANINMLILYPGQEISMNDAFLPRTAANGYREAGAYMNGRVIQAMGGGICQVSSTVYNAAMNSGLTVTERHPHSMPVHYLPLGQDAAISAGSKDLKIRNDFDFPVLFETYTENKKLTVNIYTNALKTAGASFRLHAVRTGSLSANTYLEVVLNGVVLEDRFIGTSRYNPMLPDTEEED